LKISTILDHIDSGHMALPEFQRGYVWNRDQVRSLMESLYRRHPVGSLLVWVTQSESAQHRGESQLAPGVVKLLLDGQQRMTSVYGIVRSGPPPFFDGNAESFTGLFFHLEREEFAFYSPVNMGDDPLWVDVSALMRGGYDGIDKIAEKAGGRHYGRMNRLLGIQEMDIHVEEVTGADKTIDVVVNIFNKVNSGGTKLSGGDLALAKVCAEWPEARNRMKSDLERWRTAGYSFSLDWLLRNVNTVTTGEARFAHLHDIALERVQDGLQRAEKAIDEALNLVSGRLGLDHDRVLFGRFAFPVIVHYLDRRGSLADAAERDQLLFWFIQSAMWGRFSGTTETMIDKDLQALAELDGGLQRLIEELRLWRGSLRVAPAHFSGWSLGARFYPVLYMLTRICKAKDWGNGFLELSQHLLGRMNRLEVHHIFPKAVLRKLKRPKTEVNAVANFCFLTKKTNMEIGARRPDEYFAEVESGCPGALASQWIPMDPVLWKPENYLDFLEARRGLLAAAANAFLDDLAHGLVSMDSEKAAVLDLELMAGDGAVAAVSGRSESPEEDAELDDLNEWVVELGLPPGERTFRLSDPQTGRLLAVFDLAWPRGLQTGYSQPVAVLLNEPPATLQVANAHGYRYFESAAAFKNHVSEEVVGESGVAGDVGGAVAAKHE